jgi:hypothetical protein
MFIGAQTNIKSRDVFVRPVVKVFSLSLNICRFNFFLLNLTIHLIKGIKVIKNKYILK